ncbi:Asp-tRNA(Asn)/Glu-tRNA(Gln) amidotransferase subunit GatA [Dissulfurirhabdus thermomarina]|uniref:Glutamyl-tRNA(Gln) amidotransferase subunit A n=1 Tax=Dissulfurirhabdus thermomarina TaxID=1765737 RepID=A0A6N9TM50_DISTH|nr:Asp-tRNA(Asn)/Glu-tRNA(Gln) amidotransferase subunit GatA [Dissulfurirhabdus thermomarina]NDY42199.1 Asp-tRNA(Asn)/Glu-tRNA(Gln) amidotransferase subunit GatA [Dissulfurirhabdus thermomarina]NMX22673.1 Asp-tRNA(Asn)/Glu-tRNA(Gln) amidotransferase subunit GatA [Dissulfurirhabdus thermomarina]
MSELTELTIGQLHRRLRAREVSAVEVARAYLDRISAVDPKVGAYLTVTEELALAQAEAADRRLAEGRDVTPLTGVPLGIKDVLCTRGVRTTCASRMLERFVPPFNATVMDRLEAAGAVMLGKLNMDEFAMGSSTENSAFHVTRNPWDLERIPGGSSGGSAAAVAARTCAGSLGSDTGGSIRQPAAHCGVVGLKPTYGRVSRFGLVAFASSLDQVGPITRDVTDAALLLNAIAGHDPADSTSVPREVPDYTRALVEGMDGVRVGLPRQFFVAGLDPELEAAVRAGVRALEERGAQVVEVDLPHNEYAVAAYYLVAPAEACSNLSRYDGVRYTYRAAEAGNLIEMYKRSRSEAFGPEVKRRIMIGTYALSAGYYDAFYKKASQVRTLIVEDFARAFEACDVIAAPVTPTPAFRIGERVGDPLQMYLSDIFTISVNLAGIPGMSVPCGRTGAGLPVGLQLMAPYFGEDRLFRAAYNLERALGPGGAPPL